jgi:hypothetical protein
MKIHTTRELFGLLTITFALFALLAPILAPAVTAQEIPAHEEGGSEERSGREGREEITVRQGEIVSVIVDTNIPLTTTDQVSVTVAVPDLRYFRDLTIRAGGDILVDTFTADGAAGSYDMSVRVGVNGETIRFSRYILTILPGTMERTGGVGENRNRVLITPASVTPAHQVFGSGIRVPAIPDREPGERFVIPVTVEEGGTYVVGIPRLDFAYYEVPRPATVSDGGTIPILVTLKENMQPGLYAIPITVGEDTVTARIRVIAYRETTYSSWMLPVGLAFIITALVLLFLWGFPRNRQQFPPPRPPDEGTWRGKGEKEELITYY